MNLQPCPHGGQRGYFALSIALLLTAVTSILILNLGANFSRLEADSILIEERENYAVARQLEAIVHASLQRSLGQESYAHGGPVDIVGEINAQLSAIQLPPNSTIHLLNPGSLPSEPTLSFYPVGPSRSYRIPAMGELEAADLSFGSAGPFLEHGFYLSAGRFSTHDQLCQETFWRIQSRHQCRSNHSRSCPHLTTTNPS